MELKPRSKLQALTALNVSTGEEPEDGNFISSLLTRASPAQFMTAVKMTVPAILKFLNRRVWKDWGFYNQEHKFVGIGTYRMAPVSKEQIALTGQIQVLKFKYDDAQGEVCAEVSGSQITRNGVPAVIAIVLLDREKNEPLPLNYNLALSRKKLENGLLRITLHIPESFRSKRAKIRAYLLSEMNLLKSKEF